MRDMLSIIQQRLASATQFSVATIDGELAISSHTWSRTVCAVEHRDETGRAVVFLAHICDDAHADPRCMLRACARIGAGAIALIGDGYFARFVVPDAQLETAPLSTILAYIHDLASSLDAGRARDVDALRALTYLAA